MNAEHKQTCREALVSKIENTEAMIHALKAMRDSIYGITAKESAELEKMQLCLTGLRAALAALDEPPTGWQPVWGIEINGIEVDAGGNSIGMAAIDAHGCEWYAEAMLPDNIRLCRLSPQPPAMPADVREAIDDALTCWMVDASISVANGVYPQAYEDKRRGTVERVRAWLDAHSPHP